MPAKLAATKNCAPYGNTPCTIHEKTSNKLAALRGSIAYFVAMSFASGPAIKIAIVLLAVAKFVRATSAAIPNSAPLLGSV